MGIDGDQIPFAAYQQFHCFHPCHFQNFGGMMMGGGRHIGTWVDGKGMVKGQIMHLQSKNITMPGKRVVIGLH